jgi:integrase
VQALLAACGDDAKLRLFIRTQICSGLAISDVINLRSHHLTGIDMIETKRQKTDKDVRVRIPADLHHDLRLVLPFFAGKRESGVAMWSEKIRIAMCKADVYKPGIGSTHRLRDTFCDRQLAAGVPLQFIALAMGDLASTIESHYGDLASFRMRQQQAECPVVRYD